MGHDLDGEPVAHDDPRFREYMSVSDLRRLNGMASGQSLIRAGQKLVVHGPAGAVHVVRRGDTLTEIAASYGVRLSDLLYVNKLSRKSVIYPGQEIHIP